MAAEVHSMVGASSAHRWMNCPGSVALCATLPKGSGVVSDYATTGSAAHLVGEYCLRRNMHPTEFVGERLQVGDNLVEVTEDMANSVAVYVEEVRRVLGETNGELFVEQGFTLDWLHPALFGTNDSSVMDQFSTLYVFDYKNGRKPVDANDNPQLKYYALGALGAANNALVEHVVCTIVQPNTFDGASAIKVWKTTPEELYKWAREELLPATEKALAGSDEYHDGDWCQFCDAAAICPLHNSRTMAVLKDEVPAGPEKLQLADLGRMYAFVCGEKFLAWQAALGKYVQQLVDQGVEIPGLRVEEYEVKGNRKWADETAVKAALKDVLGDEMYSQSLKSPAQIEKALTAKGLTKTERGELVSPLVMREVSTRKRAVSADAPVRKDSAPNHALDVF